MTRAAFILALVLWVGAAGRDGFDRWVDRTELPALIAAHSTEVVDRHGALLRAYPVEDGRWRLAVSQDAVDPDYLRMLLRYEDKRFYQHAGVDVRAVARAAWQAVEAREIVSGGSTLTMQVARLIEDGPTGRWSGKLRQVRVALALERRLEKDQILSLYLHHAPYGGNIEGVRAASLAWFGKPPRRLTPAEAALLVALPQSPETRRPDRHPKAAQAARDRVLTLMQKAGVLPDGAVSTAQQNRVSTRRLALPQLAPHLTDRARTQAEGTEAITLTLDADLQAGVEALARQATEARTDRVQIAIVVADHQTGAILAHAGSRAYRADGRAGFVDLTRARRSPGSTLKPLVYGLGFDRGMIHPETLIADRPMDFGGYAPQNFDGLFRGDLRVRDALRLSLNIPVVAVTEQMGPQHLMAALQRAGADPRVPGDVPGLAVALGGVGITLEELVQLYAGLANGGQRQPLRWLAEEVQASQQPTIIGRAAAWHVGDILSDTPRPRGVRGAGIAFKTGTSYGHRDAWAIGFDGQHVVGVWMGRADGTPVPGAFGGDLAAPVMFQAFARLGTGIAPLPPPPPETLIVTTSDLPQALRRFGGIAEARAGTDLQIAFPPDGAVIEGQDLTVRVRDGAPPFVWLADGKPVAQSHRRQVDLNGLGTGFAALTVVDATGQSAQARITLTAR